MSEVPTSGPAGSIFLDAVTHQVGKHMARCLPVSLYPEELSPEKLEEVQQACATTIASQLEFFRAVGETPAIRIGTIRSIQEPISSIANISLLGLGEFLPWHNYIEFSCEVPERLQAWRLAVFSRHSIKIESGTSSVIRIDWTPKGCTLKQVDLVPEKQGVEERSNSNPPPSPIAMEMTGPQAVIAGKRLEQLFQQYQRDQLIYTLDCFNCNHFSDTIVTKLTAPPPAQGIGGIVSEGIGRVAGRYGCSLLPRFMNPIAQMDEKEQRELKYLCDESLIHHALFCKLLHRDRVQLLRYSVRQEPIEGQGPVPLHGYIVLEFHCERNISERTQRHCKQMDIYPVVGNSIFVRMDWCRVGCSVMPLFDVDSEQGSWFLLTEEQSKYAFANLENTFDLWSEDAKYYDPQMFNCNHFNDAITQVLST